MVLGVLGVSARSENHENANILGLCEVKVKSYSSNVKQNISTKLLAFPNLKFKTKNRPLTPTEPKSFFIYKPPIEFLSWRGITGSYGMGGPLSSLAGCG